MKNFLNKIWVWLKFSSANPQEVSLTFKAALTAVLTALTVVLGFAHIQLPSDQLTAFMDAGVQLVQAVLLALASAMTVWGVLRKLWTTVRGTNAVIQEHPAFQ